VGGGDGRAGDSKDEDEPSGGLEGEEAKGFFGSCTLILQYSFHIRLVSMAASTQALITFGPP